MRSNNNRNRNKIKNNSVANTDAYKYKKVDNISYASIIGAKTSDRSQINRNESFITQFDHNSLIVNSQRIIEGNNSYQTGQYDICEKNVDRLKKIEQ